jgi:DNA-binding transcriptional LysR family regulator
MRIAPAVLLQDFYRMHPEIELDIVTLAADTDSDAAIAAVAAGSIDATFHAVTVPVSQLPDGIGAARVIDEPHQLLVGPGHAFASSRAVTPAQLAGHRIWMPGLARGSEVAAYYDELAAAFGLTIDVVGPVFGNEALLDEIADSSQLSTLIGAGSRYLWPDSYGLRRIPVRNPTPVYPLSLIWRRDNPHPGLATLRNYLVSTRPADPDADIWTTTWGPVRASSGQRAHGSQPQVLCLRLQQLSTKEVRPITALSGRVLSSHGRTVHLA